MPFGSLWLPVLLSTVAVFVASLIACMLLPHHRSDYKKLPKEDVVLDAVRQQSVSPGMYMLPGCDRGNWKDPTFEEKQKKGPNGVLVLARGEPNMGKLTASWLLYCFLVSFFTAYVGRHALHAGQDALAVMRTMTTVAATAYVVGQMPPSIWTSHPWSVTLKGMADGLVYALITGGLFTCLWPKA